MSIPPHVETQLRSQAVTEELKDVTEWAKITDIVRDSYYLPFPEGFSCDVPMEQRLSVASMQRDICGHIQKAFHFQHGSYTSYMRSLQKQKAWPFGNIPRPTRLLASKKRIHTMIDKRCVKLQVPDWTIQWYKFLYDQVLRQAEQLIELSHAYPTCHKLFAETTGHEPTGDVTTLFSPFAMHIRCKEPKDFLLLYNTDVDNDEKENDVNFRGFSSCYTYKAIADDVRVTAENVARQTECAGSLRTFRHEKRHALYALFEHSTTVVDLSLHAKPQKKRCMATAFDSDIQDEITAWSEIATNFDGVFGPNRSYDYVPRRKKQLIKHKVTKKYVSQFEAGAREHINDVVPRAQEALRQLKNAHIEQNILDELLRITPLAQWPELAATYGRK